MQISLINPSPVSHDGSITMHSEEGLRVTMDGVQEDRWETAYVWFEMHLQAADGNEGPITAEHLQRAALARWQDGHKPVPTLEELAYGMRRLVFLGVARDMNH